MRSIVILVTLLVSYSAAQNADPNQLISIPAEQFLQQLRNWQIALSAPQSQEVSGNTRNYGGGVPPPTGPIVVPPPPEYQGGGYYPAPPSPQPTPKPIKPTLPPTTKPPPPQPPKSPLAQYCKKPRGQFPSKTCNKYVNCWDDVVVEQECPKGLVFNEKGFCDYPANVDCSRRPVPPKSEQPPQTMPPQTTGQNVRCPTLYGYYRDQKNCSIFYMCVGGQPIKFECPPTLVFNTEILVCDYHYNVPECPKPYIPPRPTVKPPTPPPVTIHYPTAPPPPVYPPYNPYQLREAPQGILEEEDLCVEGTLERLTEDCSEVSLCRAGKTEVIRCGEGQGYDSVEDRCLASHLARC